MALTLKKGDRVRVKPGTDTDDMDLAGKVGEITDVTGSDYYVEFPGVGEIQFFAGELQKVKSLPATGEKAMALKWEKVGDELKSSDGRFVIWTLDGRNFSLDDKKYSRGYPAISKTVKGCKQRAEMILAEEAPRKSLPATGTKAMTQFIEGSKVRTGNVRHVPAQYRNAEGVVTYTNREWIFVTFPDGSQHKFYERELTPVASTKSLELRAKYKTVPKKSEVDKLREKLHRLNEKLKNTRAGTKAHKEAQEEYTKVQDKIGQLLGYHRSITQG